MPKPKQLIYKFFFLLLLVFLIVPIATPCLAVIGQPPMIIKVEPRQVRQNEIFDLHIYGVNFNKGLVLKFKPAKGLEVKKINIPFGGNHIIARINVEKDALLGSRDLTIINSNGLSDISTKALTILRARLKERPKVRIVEINFDPRGRDAGREWLKIHNQGLTSVNLKDWTISDNTGQIIANLPGWEMPADSFLTVYFGRGKNDADFSGGQGSFHTGSGFEVLRNTADEIGLYADSPSSEFIVDFLAWSATPDYRPGRAHKYALEAGIWEKGKYFNISTFNEGDILKRGELEKLIGQPPIVRAQKLAEQFDNWLGKRAKIFRWFFGSGLCRAKLVFKDGYKIQLALRIKQGAIVDMEPWVDDDNDGIPNVWEREPDYKISYQFYITEKGLEKLIKTKNWLDGLKQVWGKEIRWEAQEPNGKVKMAVLNTGLKVCFWLRSAWKKIIRK